MKPFLIVTPNSPPLVCGLADHSLGLRRLLPEGTLLWARNSLPRVSEWPTGWRELARSLRAVRGGTVIIQYTPFGFGRLPVQPFVLLVTLCSRLLDARVIVVFHEEPQSAVGLLATLRWWIETIMLKLAAAVIVSDPTWVDMIQGRAGRKQIVVAPIPSNFEHVAAAARPSGASSGASPTIVLFGKNAPNKRLDRRLLSEVLRHVRKETGRLEVIAIGEDWDEVAGLGIDIRGPLDPKDVKRLSSDAIALFPFRAVLGHRSGSIALMLEAGAPVVSCGHTPPECPTCRAFGGLVVCVDNATAASNALLRFINDPRTSREIARAGKQFYEQHLSWRRVEEQIAPVVNGR